MDDPHHETVIKYSKVNTSEEISSFLSDRGFECVYQNQYSDDSCEKRYLNFDLNAHASLEVSAGNVINSKIGVLFECSSCLYPGMWSFYYLGGVVHLGILNLVKGPAFEQFNYAVSQHKTIKGLPHRVLWLNKKDFLEAAQKYPSLSYPEIAAKGVASEDFNAWLRMFIQNMHSYRRVYYRDVTRAKFYHLDSSVKECFLVAETFPYTQ